VIDAAAVGGRYRFVGGPAIEDLHLIQAMQIYAGVRALRDHELEIQLHVAELFFRHEIHRAACRSIHHGSARDVAWNRSQARGTEQAVPQDGRCRHPLVLCGRLALPAREIFSREKRLPAFLDEVVRISVHFRVVQLRAPLGRQGQERKSAQEH
jgi:hypothetical protein